MSTNQYHAHENEDNDGTFVFDENEDNDGTFAFNENEDNDGTFVFEENEDNDDTFVFDENEDNDGTSLFDENEDNDGLQEPSNLSNADAINAIPPIEVPELSLAELNEKTDNFGPKTLVGEGSCGGVYNAFLDEKKVAVKKFNVFANPAIKDEFMTQVSRVSTLKHDNFVEMVGYCCEGNHPILAYEFATMGSLYDILHGGNEVGGVEPGAVLDWTQRIRIAVDVAKGLEYLHEKVNPSIIHRGVRSSNVLLFDDYKAKIADFHLFKRSVDLTQQHGGTTRDIASYGYNPPEYSMTGNLYKGSDIYNFAVVLLELLTGRKSVDYTMPIGQHSLVTWATPLLSEDMVKECVDPRLEGEYPPNGVVKLAAIASLCLQDEPDFRPNMSIVVKALSPLLPKKPAVPEVPQVPQLSLNELTEKTDNFGSKALVGEGSCGRVYYVLLDDVKQIVVKKLDVSADPELENEFLTQVSRVSKLKHENFVEMLGYCFEENYRILCYEFATMGSLHDILHGKKGVKGAEPGPVLDWTQRVGIAIDAAKGLEYLHKNEPSIIHRDVQSRNVLLFDDYKAKIADFNLFKPSVDMTERTSGYDAPEYLMGGYLYQESDVYSFGVVLLELLTGRKPIDYTMPTGQENLVTWVTSLLNENMVIECVDPRLEGEYPPRGVAKLANIASRCLNDELVYRPNMSYVMKLLSSLLVQEPDVDISDPAFDDYFD